MEKSQNILKEKIQMRFKALGKPKAYTFTFSLPEYRGQESRAYEIELTDFATIPTNDVKELEFLIPDGKIHEVLLNTAIVTVTNDVLPKFPNVEVFKVDWKNYTSSWIEDQVFIDFCGRISSLKFLRSLTIGFKGCYNTSDTDLNALGANFGNMKGLQELDVNFQRVFHHEVMAKYSQAFKKYEDEEIDHISNKGFANFSEALGKLENLKKLTINFAMHQYIKDVSQLNKTLLSLKELTDVSITMFGCSSIYDVSQGLSSSALKMPKDFDFFCCGNRDEGKEEKKKLPAFSKLLNATFNYGETSSDQKTVGKLLEALTTATDLASLNLQFNDCQLIVDDDLLQIAEILQQFPSLQLCILEFDGCAKIENKGFSKLIQTLSKLEKLNALQLFFSYSRISDKGLEEFGKLTTTQFKALQMLVLNLKYCKLGGPAKEDFRRRLKDRKLFQQNEISLD
jgi:hypothetical protein